MTAERLARALGARKRRPSDSDTEVAAHGDRRGRHHRDEQIKFVRIAEVAERLNVNARTVRRWIVAGDLVVHRIGNVVRVSEGDLRTFLALHRDS
jgi:excisionase family DNA binding protein